MLKNSLLIASAIVAVSAFTGFAAQANPIYVGYSLNGGTTITDIGTSGNDGTAGTGGTTVTAGNFSIQISATGQPAGTATSLFSNTLDITTTGGGGSIILYASETNNTSRSISFTTGFSNDSQSSVSVTESSYLGLANSKYSVTSPYALASQSVTPGQQMGLITTAAPSSLPALYSLTEAYSATFTGPNQRLIATLSVTSATATAVPEPASMALLGAGLVSVGLLRRRRAK